MKFQKLILMVLHGNGMGKTEPQITVFHFLFWNSIQLPFSVWHSLIPKKT